MNELNDWELTADQLDDKYNPEGEGEHPVLTRKNWMYAVANEDTLQGYWDWVLHECAIAEDDRLAEEEVKK